MNVHSSVWAGRGLVVGEKVWVMKDERLKKGKGSSNVERDRERRR